MKQQFKEEESEGPRTQHLSNVTPEVQTTPLVEITTAVTVQKRNDRRGWPYFAIGAFVLLVASVSFIVSTHRPHLSFEGESDVAQTIGIGPLTEFYSVFFVFALQLIVATIYILYGLWIRKHGASGRLPAYQKWATRRLTKVSDKDRARSAWMLRGSAVVGALMLTAANLIPLFYESKMNMRAGLPPIPLDRYLSTANSIILSLAMFGLLWIDANAIHPLRPPNKNQ
jgi:hypothetical protein